MLDEELAAIKKDLADEMGGAGPTPGSSSPMNARARMRDDLMRALKEEMGNQLDERRKELENMVDFKVGAQDYVHTSLGQLELACSCPCCMPSSSSIPPSLS